MLITDTSDLWWKSAVVYCVDVDTFYDANGDGVGDLQGLTERIDYLAALGVNCLWLMPFYPSPNRDGGYDITDYLNVNDKLGDMGRMVELLRTAHDRGIRVIADFVVNHTSDQHPWFIESRSGTDNPKRDWYWWRKPREGRAAGTPGAEPTNWMGFFSEPAWTLDPQTQEYYLHLFAREQPDLNWENPTVRQEIYRMLRWWLDRGVDGFRMDVINLISKDTALPDGDAVPSTPYGDGSKFYTSGPRIHEYMHEFNREVLAGRDSCWSPWGRCPG